MRRVYLDDPLVEGATLARDIVGPGGDPIARAGHRLAGRALRALAERGATVCYVEDEAGAGVDAAPLPDHPAVEATRNALSELCRVLARDLGPLQRHPTSRALEEIKNARPLKTAAFALDGVRATAPALAGAARNVSGAAGLLFDRHPTDDLVGHSVHVAVIAGRLGAAIGFSENDLATTVFAALLHDLGLLAVPDEVRRTPEARRSPAEQRRWEDHTLLGEMILGPASLRTPAVPIVAVEHHESQNGAGFPRGLTGGNRILRAAEHAADRTRIALVSEVIATADRYERLVAPAVGTRPLSAAAARTVLTVEAGAVLNAEVVARMLDVIPAWPLGSEVRLHGGEHDGAHAVVTGFDARLPERPAVRVFADASRRPVEPVDLDLREAPALMLEPVDLPSQAPGLAAGRA
ncbi:MAG: hypothetical protein AMXMBFR23_19690 [Chloroflexota bacterium]